MPRTRVFNEDQALEAAMLLFWEKGYEATSMQGLEQAMGLNRTSIYNAFGNKRALFQLVLNQYLNVVLSQFLLSLKHASTAKQAMENVLKEVIRLHFNKNYPGGCLVVLSLLENHQHDQKTRTILNAALKNLTKAIIKRLEQGINEGELAEDFDCRSVANQVLALITGMIVMAKANVPKKELESLISSFLSLKMLDNQSSKETVDI